MYKKLFIIDENCIEKPWVTEKIPSGQLYTLIMTGDESVPAVSITSPSIFPPLNIKNSLVLNRFVFLIV